MAIDEIANKRKMNKINNVIKKSHGKNLFFPKYNTIIEYMLSSPIKNRMWKLSVL